MFIKGTTYTREYISAKLGGGIQDCISHTGRRVVAICLKRELNPEAPTVMLVGTGRDKCRYSDILCNEQNEAVPIFLKKSSRSWEFMGRFRVVSHSKEPDTIGAYQRTSGRNDVYMIIHFEEV